MPNRTHFHVALLSGFLSFVVFSQGARAGQYFQDYSGAAVGATVIGDGSQLFSTQLGTVAKVVDGTYKELQLVTNGVTFMKSALLLPDLDPGAPVYAFSAKWNSSLSGAFPNTAADGFSFNFGQLRGLDLLQGNVESGYSTGLCFYVMTWTGAAPGFYISVNGTNAAAIFTNNPGAVWGTNSTARHFFEVDWHWINGMTVRMDGQTLFTNVPTAGFMPRAGDGFVWAARVGGYSETVALDNITVLTGGNLNKIPLGSPYYFSSDNPPDETAGKAFDGLGGTKWLGLSAGGFIGAQVQGTPAAVRAYAITSANDLPTRDPSIWQLQQTTNSGGTWLDRASHFGYFANRFEQRAWGVVAGSPASGYRLNILANNSAPVTQLSELALYQFDDFAGIPLITSSPTFVSNTVAFFSGTVNPNLSTTFAWLEWGNTTNFGTSSTPVSLGSGSAALPVNFAATGLFPGAPYYIRLVATNAAGIVRSATSFFRTTPLMLAGANPLTNECHTTYSEAGVTAIAAPLALSGGSFHTLALRGDGTVVAWGAGTSNPNSQPDFGQSAVPGGLTDVIAVAAGSYHSLALRSNGTVTAWGRNNNNQLGIAGQANVRAIAGGLEHSVALKNDGTVVSSGNNQYGQNTVPATATNIFAVDVGEYHNVVVRSNGSVIAWGAGTTWNPGGFVHYGQAIVPSSATNVMAVAAGAYHCLALRSNGTIVAWGAGTNVNPSDLESYGQCIVPPNATNIIAIAAGSRHSLALRADGTVLAWGDSGAGQLNVPSAATNIVAIAGGGDHSLALRVDGAVFGWGYNSHGQAGFPAMATNISAAFTVSGIIDTNTPGSYVLTYSFTNALGAVGIATRTVVVADRTAPTLTLIGANPLYLNLGAPFSEPGYLAADTCQGDITANVQITGSVNSSIVGTNILTYSVSDASGNNRTTNRIVLVVSEPSITGISAQNTATNGVTGTRTITLNANVNPNGRATGGYFQYGLTANYTGSNGVATFAAGFAANLLSTPVSNLLAGVTYHFRVVATNSVGTTTSPDQSIVVNPAFVRGDFDGDGVVNQSELNSVLSNYFPTSPWLRLTNVAGLGGSNVTFGLTNSLAGSFQVEASTNLVDWIPLGPAIPRYEFTDTNAPSIPQRSYRLRWP